MIIYARLNEPTTVNRCTYDGDGFEIKTRAPEK